MGRLVVGLWIISYVCINLTLVQSHLTSNQEINFSCMKLRDKY